MELINSTKTLTKHDISIIIESVKKLKVQLEEDLRKTKFGDIILENVLDEYRMQFVYNLSRSREDFMKAGSVYMGYRKPTSRDKYNALLEEPKYQKLIEYVQSVVFFRNRDIYHKANFPFDVFDIMACDPNPDYLCSREYMTKLYKYSDTFVRDSGEKMPVFSYQIYRKAESYIKNVVESAVSKERNYKFLIYYNHIKIPEKKIYPQYSNYLILDSINIISDIYDIEAIAKLVHGRDNGKRIHYFFYRIALKVAKYIQYKIIREVFVRYPGINILITNETSDLYGISCMCKNLGILGLDKYVITAIFNLFYKSQLQNIRDKYISQGYYTVDSAYDHQDEVILRNFILYFRTVFRIGNIHRVDVKYIYMDSPIEETEILSIERLGYLHSTIKFINDVWYKETEIEYNKILDSKYGKPPRFNSYGNWRDNIELLDSEERESQERLYSKYQRELDRRPEGDAEVFILAGPTGSGKSYIMNRIAEENNAYSIVKDNWARYEHSPERFNAMINEASEYAKKLCSVYAEDNINKLLYSRIFKRFVECVFRRFYNPTLLTFQRVIEYAINTKKNIVVEVTGKSIEHFTSIISLAGSMPAKFHLVYIHTYFPYHYYNMIMRGSQNPSITMIDYYSLLEVSNQVFDLASKCLRDPVYTSKKIYQVDPINKVQLVYNGAVYKSHSHIAETKYRELLRGLESKSGSYEGIIYIGITAVIAILLFYIILLFIPSRDIYTPLPLKNFSHFRSTDCNISG